MIDTIVRGGTLVRPDGRVKADIRMSEGRIVEIAPDLKRAAHEIDATGLHVFPGLIDAHLHFNEPGRTEWEGAETGSHALAAGGGTLFFDMPLNSTPCTITADAVDAKRAALEASSVTDFGSVGRAGSGLCRPDGRDGRARRRRLQGVHVRFGPCRVRVRR